MQTRDQVKNWKVVVSTASIAALGLTGLALASPDGSNEAPPAIDIDQRERGQSAVVTSTTGPSFQVVPGPVVTPGDDSLDSPLASASLDDSPEDSPDSSPDVVADDSPDDSPDVVADDSPDDSPDDSDSQDSVDSSD
jgi:hypothetical protein